MNPSIRGAIGLGMATLILMSLAGTGHPLPSDALICPGERARVGGGCTVASQIAGIDHHGNGPPVLISIVISEVGFALGQGDEILPVRLQVEKVKGLDPSRVRRLLGENRTLGEIKAQIEGDDGAYIYRGHLRLGHAHYLLENLNVTSFELNTTLEADLMEPVWGWCAIPTAPGPRLEIAGRILVEARRGNGSEIGAGSLVIFSGPYAGSYAVILDSSIGVGWDMAACPACAEDSAISDLLDACEPGGLIASPTSGGPGRPVSILETILSGPDAAGISPPICPGCCRGAFPFEPEPHYATLRGLWCGGRGPGFGMGGWGGGDGLAGI